MEGSFLLDKALDGSFIGYHLNGTIISEVFLHDYQKLCKQSTNGNDFMWMFWLGTAFIFWIKFYESTANEFRPSLPVIWVTVMVVGWWMLYNQFGLQEQLHLHSSVMIVAYNTGCLCYSISRPCYMFQKVHVNNSNYK